MVVGEILFDIVFELGVEDLIVTQGMSSWLFHAHFGTSPWEVDIQKKNRIKKK